MHVFFELTSGRIYRTVAGTYLGRPSSEWIAEIESVNPGASVGYLDIGLAVFDADLQFIDINAGGGPALANKTASPHPTYVSISTFPNPVDYVINITPDTFIQYRAFNANWNLASSETTEESGPTKTFSFSYSYTGRFKALIRELRYLEVEIEFEVAPNGSI